MDFNKIGNKIRDIPVIINPRIIELFSAGLYSSPNKAFEELICNSYDAYADKVSVYISTENKTNEDFIWVCDNGESMDSQGLRELWKIGETKKRKNEISQNKRLQIGKFGIGKLATFILANKLTYICKIKNNYKAVTMDYGCLNVGKYEPTDILLEERELTEEEVINVLQPLIELNGIQMTNFYLWGENAEESWTISIMSDLKEKAYKIRKGRLGWLLGSALPLNPGFKLLLDGLEIHSKKMDIDPWHSWIIGKNDETAERFPKDFTCSMINGESCINTKHLRNITGGFYLYRDSLVKKDKAEKRGRSNGIFIMVRGRLINEIDPLFGMDAMSHGVFNRIRIVINTDGLDDHLASTRESIQESDALEEVQLYIQRKFNYIAAMYYNLVETEEKERMATSKMAITSTSLSRRPLISLARKFLRGEIENLFLIDIPETLDESEQIEFIDRLENDLISEQGIIKDIIWEDLEPHKPIAKLDLYKGIVFINAYHPFISNFITETDTILPFELIAMIEILTEAFMVEKNIDQSKIELIMKQRDKLLRELTYRDFIPNVPNISKILENSLANSKELEEALVYVFRVLGFETEKLGKPGEPDGIAKATLGVRVSGGKREDYTVIFDAKSTKKDKIRADTIKFESINQHRVDFNANYAIVVAIDFEGAEKENTRANRGANANKISLIRGRDLLDLLLIAGPKQITLNDLKDFFESCHTVIETSEWINNMKNRVIKKKPIEEVLQTAYTIMKTDREPPTIDAIRHSHELLLKEYGREDIIGLVRSLELLIPRHISLGTNEIVYIEHSPEVILKSLSDVIKNKIPSQLLSIYLKDYSLD